MTHDKSKPGSETDEYGQPIPKGEPTPSEIRAAAAAIRKRWVEKVERERPTQPPQEWEPVTIEFVAVPPDDE
ncbi:hypothetical protein KOR34_24370 [Posidoniimonas corsicana]|uniref:Uncharacterized protein n=1 Tax=Posidoniimonas corsicana TaxID=1938618 RepID=A0A5C5VI95_9BACT|nr:hypothetical protein [Posidoniimonas corsicana]TWT37485.1 hypothetical protein KOR34_24370 [Posidoniimonas corsicana]